MKIKKLIICIALSLMILSGVFILWMYSCFMVISLPVTTGKFNVGKTVLHLIDQSRNEQHSKNTDFRELILQVFYPAQISASQKGLYADSTMLAIIKEDLSKMTGVPIEQFSYLDSLKSNSFENVQVALGQQSYPVILFSPGWGAPTNLYSSLLEDLASHGYIVVGINYPYVTNPVVFPDGRIIRGIKQPQDPQEKKITSKKEMETWIQDINFVIDKLLEINLSNNIFKNKLDTKRIGVFGHSFGGSVAVEACRNNKRCIAGADIEGKLYNNLPINKPFMFISAPHAQEILQPIKDLSKEAENIDYFEIDGANHGSFTDLYLIAKFNKNMLPTLDAFKGIQITRKLLLDFFDKYLKNSNI